MIALTRVVLRNARLFRELVDTIGNISEEISLVLTPNSLEIKAQDIDQTSLIECSMPRDMFDEYDVEETVAIGVSVNNLKKILSHVKKGENLVVELEGDYVKFTVGMGGVTRTYKFRNLEVPVPEITGLELKFTVTARLLSQSIKKVIEDIESMGGNTQIKASREALVFRSTGAGKLEVKFTTGSLALIDLEVTEQAESTYDTAKLANILGALKISDMVTLKFADKMPLRAEFSVEQIGRVVYILAPFETG